ncbi:SCO6745 family protein [Gordonia caeni]|uniref:MarR family transcriptional regulator n=1 Tax=Gordonia caeni TaxID=1007097 RepID=A0ABP7PD38_9ACTN
MNAARTAYETLEPFHVLAYFNPGLNDAMADTGLDPHAFYVGARGAPLGDCASPVVTAAFYNFNPDLIDRSWTSARAVGLAKVADRRAAMLDEQLRSILGDRAHAPEIAELADGFGELAKSLPLSGRPLSAAWAGVPLPEEPLVRLWTTVAVLREWRGDNHIAALVVNRLDGLDAAVFHEAAHPDPAVKRRVLGRDMVLLTRGWSEDDWNAAVDRLVARGLAEHTEDGHRLTADGAALYDDLEATTDALTEPVWDTPEAQDLVTRMRPYTKAILDAGVLPGTRKKD